MELTQLGLMQLGLIAQLSIARANLWIARASNDTVKLLKIQKPDTNSPSGWSDMTNDEKVVHAMGIAENHLLNAQEAVDSITNILHAIANK